MKPRNKILWTSSMVSFIQKNFHKLTNKQLAEGLGLRLTSVRTKCYKLGLKRMELEYWSKWQVNALNRLYSSRGDKEIAALFEEKWPKKKRWTLKHIEKKRLYLGLKRTPKQIAAIKQREVEKGTYRRGVAKMWRTRGVAKEGEVRYWKTNMGVPSPMIKTRRGWRHWGRYMWLKHRAKLRKGDNVVFRDGNNRNLKLSNLEVITNATLARRNSMKSSIGLSDNYVAYTMSYNQPELRKYLLQHPELLEVKRLQLLLNRKLYATKETLRDRQAPDHPVQLPGAPQ